MAEENGRAKGGRQGRKGEKGGCEEREGWGSE